MNVTIYHNPLCGTSRKTLEILRESGTEPKVVEYLKEPPSREELKRLYDRAGISPRDGLRSKEPLAEELGLTRPDVSEDEILDAMIEHPVLINRPLVETDKGVRMCRPQDVVREIL
jgi:arsenate reductase (glutaredoxin)